MSKNDIDELIEYLEQDMVALSDGIEKNEPKLKKILDIIKSGHLFFSTDFMGFTVLLRKYCFNNFNKDGVNLLKMRIDLIERIFYLPLHFDSHNRHFFLLSTDSYPPDSGMLVYFLYIAILERLHTTSKSIKEIFHDLLNEWVTTMSTSQMKISLIFYLPIYTELGDYKIAKDLYLYSKIPHIKVDETIDEPSLDLILTYDRYIQAYRFYDFNDPDDLEPLSPQKCYLVYSTQIPFERVESDLLLLGIARTKLRESNERLQRKFQEIINTLYLFGFDFNCGDYVIKLPWWYEFDIKELDKYDPRVEYRSGLTKSQIKDFSRLYSDIVQSKIFHEKKFEIIVYRYHQIFNRDYLPDIILDASIILEMLFTRGMKQELKFRFSLNGALFLAADWEEFKKYQKLLSTLYDLRSTIIHGGEWEKKIHDCINKEIFANLKVIVPSIRKLISQILKKVILLKLKDRNILNRFQEKNYFLELSYFFNKNKEMK